MPNRINHKQLKCLDSIATTAYLKASFAKQSLFNQTNSKSCCDDPKSKHEKACLRQRQILAIFGPVTSKTQLGKQQQITVKSTHRYNK